MTQRLVSVGDDFKLPVAVKVDDVNLPTRLSEAAQNATYAQGGGSARVITGPTLPTLPAGTEYIWNKTDGAGTLLDIVSGVA